MGSKEPTGIKTHPFTARPSGNRIRLADFLSVSGIPKYPPSIDCLVALCETENQSVTNLKQKRACQGNQRSSTLFAFLSCVEEDLSTVDPS
ncbi:hypothetical protein BaRGS_00035385 [Batillaria attramentaria]|uniref:Uncharacterized protein n=1 Tax=Batillaria attramentaria TaxID=370345 RepID=A0ABD0JET0_9CAEN